MARFEDAIGMVLKNEGGYVCDPADPGGETNYGICKRDHPDVDIKGLTREQAIAIYRSQYWLPLFDQIADQPLATELLDARVNQGSHPAVSALQRAINDLGGHCAAVDGVFGPATVSLVNRLDPIALLIDFKAEQALHYVELADSKPTLKKYLKGWLIRAIASVLFVILLTPVAGAQLDTLERMEQDFFMLSELCQAQPAVEMRLGGVDYRIRPYRCGHRLWRLWEFRCEEGYWSRVVLLDQGDVNEDAYYLDRFGSLHNGRPASLIEAYRPRCGT